MRAEGRMHLHTRDNGLALAFYFLFEVGDGDRRREEKKDGAPANLQKAWIIRITRTVYMDPIIMKPNAVHPPCPPRQIHL